jgi:hypothetical protein
MGTLWTQTWTRFRSNRFNYLEECVHVSKISSYIRSSVHELLKDGMF